MTQFVTKRIYDTVSPDDGYRVLVDRLWPRGVSKERAALDEWAKDISPSTDLRKWYAHDIAKYPEFARKYSKEIAHNPVASATFARWRTHSKVTLLCATRSEAGNEADVLREYLS